MVIFDEASQVKPADAIPALVRAPKVIVAGDRPAATPTEFFTKVLEAEQPSAGNEEALAFEAEQESADLTDNVGFSTEQSKDC